MAQSSPRLLVPVPRGKFRRASVRVLQKVLRVVYRVDDQGTGATGPRVGVSTSIGKYKAVGRLNNILDEGEESS